MRTAWSCVLGLGFAGILMFVPAKAFANGGDFFEELSSTWNAANADQGVPYFGFVKDKAGKGIAGAAISATTPTGSTFFVQSDKNGHYRIPGFAKSIDAKRVEIRCLKTGYKLFARDRRILRSKTDVPIETNCVMVQDAKPVS